MDLTQSENVVERLIELAAINDVEGFKESAGCDPLSVDGVGHWYGRKKNSNQMMQLQRTPLMVAATYGSIDVMKYIISLPGVNVNQSCCHDKTTALHCAVSGGSTDAVDAVQLLLDAGADPNLVDADGCRPFDVVIVSPNFQEMKSTLQGILGGEVQNQGESCASIGTQSNDVRVSSASGREEYPVDPNFPDIKSSVYATDYFRMFAFKIRPCLRTYSHDWTECPFAHPGENAQRRDPRKYHYSCMPCPDYRKGSCKRGDACEFAHGVFESWLHPAQYQTQLCKDSTNCDRKVCFFAHSVSELRPVHISTCSAISSPRSYSMSYAAPMTIVHAPALSSANQGILNMSWKLKLNVPTLLAPGSSSSQNRLPSTDPSLFSQTDAHQLHSRISTDMSNYSANRPMAVTPVNLESSFSAEFSLPGYSDQALRSHDSTGRLYQRQPESLRTIFSPHNIDPSLLQDLGLPTSSIRSLPGMDPIPPSNAQMPMVPQFRNMSNADTTAVSESSWSNRGRPSEASKEYDKLMCLASVELHHATEEPEPEPLARR